MSLNAKVLVACLALGLPAAVLGGYLQASSNGAQTRAYISYDMPVSYDGQVISLEDAYLTDTQLNKVQLDCRSAVLPTDPDEQADGTISEPVARLDVSGVRACITSGATAEVNGVTITVTNVSGKDVSGSWFTEVSLTTPPGWEIYGLQVASALVLGVAAGVAVPALRELSGSRRPRPSMPNKQGDQVPEPA